MHLHYVVIGRLPVFGFHFRESDAPEVSGTDRLAVGIAQPDRGYEGMCIEHIHDRVFSGEGFFVNVGIDGIEHRSSFLWMVEMIHYCDRR